MCARRKLWSESSVGAFWIAKDAVFLHANNEESDQIANAQTDLSLHWVRMSEVKFSRAETHIHNENMPIQIYKKIYHQKN